EFGRLGSRTIERGRLNAVVEHHLVHGARRLGTTRLADHLGRHARDGHVVGHVLDHDRTSGDARAVTDLDVPENLGAGADQHAMPDLGMTIADLLASAPERHPVQNGYVIIDDGRLTDDSPGSMIDKNAAPDARGRMDVALENLGPAALQIERE